MTVPTVLLCGLFSLVGTALLTYLLIPYLRRIKGSSVREDVPERHKQKEGTPTMGGLSFLVVPTLISLVFSSSPVTLWLSASVALFGLLGLFDDLAKVKRRKGLRTPAKLSLQVVLALSLLYLAEGAGWPVRPIDVPSGFLISLFLFLASVNGTNIADGLDGLVSGLAALALIPVAISSFLSGKEPSFLFAVALLGSCLGFLVWNHYPARVFMGDVGSLALGGGLCATALIGGAWMALFVVGMPFWIEEATVVVQVIYFKITKRIYGRGRRIFPMTPIHHSFELIGWREPVIVRTFWAVGALFAVLSLLTVTPS